MSGGGWPNCSPRSAGSCAWWTPSCARTFCASTGPREPTFTPCSPSRTWSCCAQRRTKARAGFWVRTKSRASVPKTCSSTSPPPLLVDTDALVERLRGQGDLFVALDVFDREPLDRNSVLRTLPNVYLTPHRAGGTMASAQRILDYLVDDFEAYLAGREHRHALTEAMVPSLDA